MRDERLTRSSVGRVMAFSSFVLDKQNFSRYNTD